MMLLSLKKQSWRGSEGEKMKVKDRGCTGKKLTLTCCVCYLHVCDIFYRYRRLNCNEILV